MPSSKARKRSPAPFRDKSGRFAKRPAKTRASASRKPAGAYHDASGRFAPRPFVAKRSRESLKRESIPIQEKTIIERAVVGLRRYARFRENETAAIRELKSMNRRSKRSGVSLADRDRLLRDYAFAKAQGGLTYRRSSTWWRQMEDAQDQLNLPPIRDDYEPWGDSP